MSNVIRHFNRRDFFKFGAAATVGAAFSPQGSAALGAEASTRPAGPLPKNIIYMVADGMSMGVPSLADPFSRVVRGKGTQYRSLLQDPRTTFGYYEMASLNSMVTDSAAAATSWGSGSRVFNGAINTLPDGTAMIPIGVVARELGRKRVGLVTTTTVTHATPAGFGAVSRHRDDEEHIATQYLERIDVVMGGGRDAFDGGKRYDRKDFIKKYKEKGYKYWASRDDMMNARKGAATQPIGKRVLGLFEGGMMPYTVDHRNSDDLKKKVPTLAEMAQAALELLADASNGFLLQIEGGRVDHAAHANDAAAILWDMLAFDDALEVALKFARDRGDTLIVVTSDHGNANPGLNGMGDDYVKSTQCFERIGRARASYTVISDKLKGAEVKEGMNLDKIIEIVRDYTRISISRPEAKAIASAWLGEGLSELNKQHASLVGVLGQALGNATGIGWVGTTHTADMTLVMATGPGQERFAGLAPNTSAFERLTRLMDVDFKNPRMTIEQGSKFPALDLSKPHWEG